MDPTRARKSAGAQGGAKIAKARAVAKATDSVPVYLLVLACLTVIVAGVFAVQYLATPCRRARRTRAG